MECAGCRQLCSDSVIQINQIMCGNDFKKRIDNLNFLHFSLNSCQVHFHKWSILLVVVLATFSHGKLLYQGFGCKLLQGCWKIFKHVCFQVVVEGTSFCSKTNLGSFNIEKRKLLQLTLQVFFNVVYKTQTWFLKFMKLFLKVINLTWVFFWLKMQL